jgi:hypothetical protein
MSKVNRKDMVSAWSELGRTWKKYGRAVGKVALEGVADALKKTASALDAPDEQHEKTPSSKASDTGAEKPSDKNNA